MTLTEILYPKIEKRNILMKRSLEQLQIILFASYFLLALVVQCIYITHFIADDSYFYMTVARNIALSGQQTFSGIIPTNGVHPLWLYLLSLSSWVISLINSDLLYDPLSVAPISFAVLGLGAFCSWKVARQLDLNPLVLTILPVGFLTTFSLLGSEAYLSYCCLSCLTLFSLRSTQQTRYGHIILGILAAAVFLARLDSVFFVVPFFIWYGVIQKDFRKFFVSALVAIVPSTIYVISNTMFFGGVVPISGWLKSTFPDVSIAGFTYARLSFSFFTHVKLTMGLFGYNLFFGIIPIVFSTIILLLIWRDITRQSSIVYVFWAGSVLHLVYTASFTQLAAYWLWYYVLPVMLFALTLALALKRFSLSRRPAFSIITFLLVSICFTSYTLRDFLRNKGNSQSDLMLTYLTDNDIEHATIIVADAPGRTSFLSTNRIIALDMLTANRRFVDEMMQAPNGFQFIFDYAAQENKPVTHLFWTTSTWLSILSPQQNMTEISYIFWDSDQNKHRPMGTVNLGPPVYQRPGLIVWEILPQPRSENP